MSGPLFIPVQWLTAAPHPRAFAGGFDAGRHAWKRHAVEAFDAETFKDIKGRKAACGLTARHGWDDDLFTPVRDRYLDYRCQRCVAALVRACGHDWEVSKTKTTCRRCGAHMIDGKAVDVHLAEYPFLARIEGTPA